MAISESFSTQTQNWGLVFIHCWVIHCLTPLSVLVKVWDQQSEALQSSPSGFTDNELCFFDFQLWLLSPGWEENDCQGWAARGAPPRASPSPALALCMQLLWLSAWHQRNPAWLGLLWMCEKMDTYTPAPTGHKVSVQAQDFHPGCLFSTYLKIQIYQVSVPYYHGAAKSLNSFKFSSFLLKLFCLSFTFCGKKYVWEVFLLFWQNLPPVPPSNSVFITVLVTVTCVSTFISAEIPFSSHSPWCDREQPLCLTPVGLQ